MKGVEKNLIAIKLDKDGKPIGMEFMVPGKDYETAGAYSVLEMPKYQRAGYHYLDPNQPDYSTPNGLDEEGNALEGTVAQGSVGQFGQETQFGQENQFGYTAPDISIPEVDAPGMINLRGDREGINMLDEGSNIPGMDTFGVDAQADAKRNEEIKKEEQRLLNLEKLAGNKGDNEQFFNPYGGIDIPTAATMLGQNIQQGDGFGIAASGLKLTSGLGRNIAAAYGSSNRTEQTLAEKNKKLFETQRPSYGQKGGELTVEDYQDINESTGIQFTNEGADNLFESNTYNNASTQDKSFDLGKYNDIGYYNVEDDGEGFLISPTNQNYRNNSDINKSISYIKTLNPGANIKPNYLSQDQRPDYVKNPYMPQLKKGGEMTDAEFMTGEYVKGIDEDNKHYGKANAEIERGEYLKTVDGDIGEVVGNLHSNGGERVILEDGDRLLTDYTKLGAKNAKYIRDNFDLGVKAKNTYADVLDKFKSKSGMKKLLKEEEGILEKLQEQEEKEDGQTKNLNTSFLHTKLQELTNKKTPLEEARKGLFDMLYQLQEDEKPASEKNGMEDGEYFQKAGEKFIDPVPEGQSRNSDGFYGGVTKEDYLKTVARNANWYKPFRDGTFDPNNPEHVKHYQSAAGLRPDGHFGEQTASYSRNSGVNSSLTPDSINGKPVDSMGFIPGAGPIPDLSNLEGLEVMPDGTIKDTREATTDYKTITDDKTITDGNDAEDNKKRLNILGLPDQYPMVPRGVEAALKVDRSYTGYEAPQIDPRPYMQEIDDQVQLAFSQLEGLPPSVATAAGANIKANALKAKNNVMMQIDSKNIDSKTKAEVLGARLDARTTDAQAMDNLSFESRQLMAKAKTDADFDAYFDKVQQTNVGNFRTINNINDLNERYDHVNYSGVGYDVEAKPDFMSQLSAADRDLLERYEASKKQNTKK